MPHPAVSLRDTLHVLDLADQAQVGTLTRAHLVAGAQALNTGHTLAELELAADAHLSQGAPGATAYDFGWERPSTPDALAAARQRYTRGFWRPIGWMLEPNTSGDRVLVWPVLFLCCGIWLAWWSNLRPLWGFLCILGSVATSLLSLASLIPVEKWLTQHASARLGETLLEKCMAVATTRAYLQAVVSSEVPEILGGDKKRIRQLLEQQQTLQNNEVLAIKQALAKDAQDPLGESAA